MSESDNNSNKSVLNLLSYAILMIVALLIVVNNFLPIVGIDTTGTFFVVLETIEKIFTLIVIGISAYRFTKNKHKAFKIIFWIAVALFALGVIFIWIK